MIGWMEGGVDGVDVVGEWVWSACVEGVSVCVCVRVHVLGCLCFEWWQQACVGEGV